VTKCFFVINFVAVKRKLIFLYKGYVVLHMFGYSYDNTEISFILISKFNFPV